MAKAMIHADNVEFLKVVCERDHVSYSFGNPNEKDLIPVETSASNRKLKELIKDALCEKQRAQFGDILPVYSLETLENPGKYRRLTGINRTHDYMPFMKDQEEVSRQVFQI